MMATQAPINRSPHSNTGIRELRLKSQTKIPSFAPSQQAQYCCHFLAVFQTNFSMGCPKNHTHTQFSTASEVGVVGHGLNLPCWDVATLESQTVARALMLPKHWDECARGRARLLVLSCCPPAAGQTLLLFGQTMTTVLSTGCM